VLSSYIVITKANLFSHNPNHNTHIIMTYFISAHWALLHALVLNFGIFNFTATLNAQNELIPVSNGSLWGFCDAKSKAIVIQPQFRTAYPFIEGVAIVAKEVNGKSLFGLLDTKGKEVVTPQYDDERVLKTFIAVKKGIQWGVIKTDGTAALPCEYEEIMDFSEGKFIVKKSGKVGIVDAMNKVIIPLNYEEMRSYKNGFAAVKRNRNWTFVNVKGKEISSPIYEAVQDFTESGVAIIQQFGKRGILNANGQELAPCEFDRAESEGEGLIGVSKGGKWGFLDKTGKPKIAFNYDNKQYGSFVSGLAPISVAGKWGYINAAGTEVIAPKFDMASNFAKNGLAKIQQKNKFSIINTKGDIITKQTYTTIGNFSDGLALVLRDGKYGFINESGEEIIACEYANAADFNNGLASVFDVQKNMIGYIDNTGKAFFK
jgi:WG containing repeat